MHEVDKNLVSYIEIKIFPLYQRLYAHGLKHIEYVIERSFLIAREYDVNYNMVYCIACYHDLGLLNVVSDRDSHALESGRILMQDNYLKSFFTEKQLKIMKEAVEDHSGSRRIRPRNIYGEIVSDADRDIDIETLAKRQLQTSIKYYKELISFEEHFERCYQYILTRTDKKFNLWTENKVLRSQMRKFQEKFIDKEYTRLIYQKEWDYIERNQLKEKFLNYYAD